MLGGRSVSPAIALPADALVLLIGVAASGKTTFAARHFAPTEVLSSDALRAMITDDPSAQAATDDAFDLLHRLLAMRLRRGRLTVVDATNVEDWARAELLRSRGGIAARRSRSSSTCPSRSRWNGTRARVPAPAAVGPPAAASLARDSLPALAHEGFAAVHLLRSVDEIDGARVERRRALVTVVWANGSV